MKEEAETTKGFCGKEIQLEPRSGGIQEFICHWKFPSEHHSQRKYNSVQVNTFLLNGSDQEKLDVSYFAKFNPFVNSVNQDYSRLFVFTLSFCDVIYSLIASFMILCIPH